MPKLPGRTNLFFPPALSAIYALVSLLILLGFRSFFPDGFFSRETEETFLPLYRMGRTVSRALLDWIGIFPALIMTALVLPFGMDPDYAPARRRFSRSFLNKLKPSLLTALAAAALFAVLSLMARPFLYNYQDNMRTNSRIFRQSKESAALYADKDEWMMAAGFLTVCKKIWPDKKAGLDALEARIRTGQEALLYGRPAARPAPAAGHGIPGQKQPVNAQEALALANTAMDEGRLYDAHWLAGLSARLARPGSAESSAGMRLASWAWNRIMMMEPAPEEQRLASIYRQKRAAYEALLAEEWVSAYYLWNELAPLTPGDPDTQAFLEMSREKVKEAAFFTGEMNGIAGDDIENAVFSLPAADAEGRLVIRAGYLSALADFAFINRFEALASDAEGKPRFRVETAFAKCVPLFVNGGWKTLVLLRALDRDNSLLRWEPVWTGSSSQEAGAYSMLLDIRYEDFLLAAAGARDLKGFYLADFWRAAAVLGPYGFVPEVFQAEIIRALSEPLLFLPVAVFALILAWRLRARNRPRFSGVPMALALPFVFNALFGIILGFLMNVYTIILLSSGWTAALSAALILAALLFITSLFFLAAEHG